MSYPRQTFKLIKKNRKYFDAVVISYRDFKREIFINKDNENLELNKKIDLETAKKHKLKDNFCYYMEDYGLTGSLGYSVDYVVLEKKKRKYFDATLYCYKVYKNAKILIDENTENLKLNKEIKNFNLEHIGEKTEFGTDLKFKVKQKQKQKQA